MFLNRDLYLVVGFERIVLMLLKVYISIKFPIDPDVVFLGRGFDLGGAIRIAEPLWLKVCLDVLSLDAGSAKKRHDVWL